jgi:tetratricopeptide (TPR) repeat protein
VLSRDPPHLKALFNIARFYQTQGDYAEDIWYGEKALERDPQNALAYTSLGLIYEEMGACPKPFWFSKPLLSSTFAFPRPISISPVPYTTITPGN